MNHHAFIFVEALIKTVLVHFWEGFVSIRAYFDFGRHFLRLYFTGNRLGNSLSIRFINDGKLGYMLL